MTDKMQVKFYKTILNKLLLCLDICEPNVNIGC